MVKRKVINKPVPPDISAVKLLYELQGETDYTKFTEEELIKEKERLLKLLNKN